jgi:transposase
MLVFESKLEGMQQQYDALDEAIRTARFIDLRKSERALKRVQKRLSRKQKGSKNRIKARGKLGKKHLRVSRQRKDFAVGGGRMSINILLNKYFCC